MAVLLEITDRDGFRTETVDASAFWIGCDPNSDVRVGIPDCASRVLEVRTEPGGRILARVEPGLQFPVRCATGDVRDRFDALLDGDVVNVGPVMLKIRYVPTDRESAVAEVLDLETVSAPGTAIGSWYQTFMEVADHLEGLHDPESMIDTALSGIVESTGADRAMLSLDREIVGADSNRSTDWFYSHDGDRASFGLSRSLIDRVREGGQAVHVPVASADPVASQFASVRREGISSGIVLPIQALGRRVGVLYADCVREGRVLSVEDLQRVAFIGRLLASALGNRDLMSELVRVNPDQPASDEHPALRSRSPACSRMIERVKLYAPTDYTVLLRGETGVGKEVLAHALHDLSRRSAGKFVPVNCAAIPEQLMESMLFGHEKGAFTGATQSRAGHFEEAHGGTLFLDEIGDMPIDLQSKILRVLQDRVVTPLGSSRQIKVDVRVIAATHQDLERMIDERTFREDLYFRINELEIRLPTLRERSEDVFDLSARFLAESAGELGLDAPQEIAADALRALETRTWRGNIRELRHVIRGAALRARGGPIRLEHLDEIRAASSEPVRDERDSAASPSTWKERLDQQEALALQETFDRAGGNLTKGAELFGVPRTTYREKLKRHGLLSHD
ncbi:MAG: sigma-54-dependent Fis family transcriptional regulator [Planctomycetes bacterium]|nr:sigma-54-dependent Fis family transcriptional regulator [Planctomycetota bacterium]